MAITADAAAVKNSVFQSHAVSATIYDRPLNMHSNESHVSMLEIHQASINTIK